MRSFKIINTGALIRQRVLESDIDSSRICKYFNCTEEDINEMYSSESMDSSILLKWSKLLEYDFFRIYSQHLILFSPQSNACFISKDKNTNMPQFRKNIYTKEIIDFILGLIYSREKKMSEIIKEYNIPKTTLYRWMVKYKHHEIEKELKI